MAQSLVANAIEPQLGPWPDRLLNSILTGGTWKPTGSYEVTAPGGMFVQVGSGTVGDLAVVPGSSAGQGSYLVTNPNGNVDFGSGSDLAINPGDPSDDRIDLIVLRVYDDAFDSTGQTEPSVEVVEGTPAASPSAPATPDSAIALAEVLVAAGESTAIQSGDITDVRDTSLVDDDSMATRRFERLGSHILSAAATSLVVGSLPSTHRHLLVVITGFHTGGSGFDAANIRLNGSSTSGDYMFARHRVEADGTSTPAGNSSATAIASAVIGIQRSGIELTVHNYSLAHGNHPCEWSGGGRSGTGGAGFRHETGSGVFIPSGAITEVRADMATNQWAAASAMHVYGLLG